MSLATETVCLEDLYHFFLVKSSFVLEIAEADLMAAVEV